MYVTIGWTCSSDGGENKCARNYFDRLPSKSASLKMERTWVENIKIGLKGK